MVLFCIGVATGLLILVAYVTWLIMQAESSAENARRLIRVKKTFKDLPFSTVCFFFSVFLCVTYLLSFAFAFHDREAHGKGLYASGTPVPRKPTPNPGNGGGTWKILFGNYSAVVDIDPAVGTDSEAIRKNHGTTQKADRISHNNTALKAIKTLIQQKNKNYERIRITLIGHADPNPVTDDRTPDSRSSRTNRELLPYKSNYELSEARTHELHRFLSNELEINMPANRAENPNDLPEGNNIEWLLSSISAENTIY